LNNRIMRCCFFKNSKSHISHFGQSHNRIDGYYSTGKDRDGIFVAEYTTKLPSEEEIIKKLKKLK